MSLTVLFKGLTSIWPFIKEMFFAGKTTKEIVLENKLAVLLLMLLAVSVLLNYVTLGKIYEIAVNRRPEAKPPVTAPAPTSSAPAAQAAASEAEAHTLRIERTKKRLREIYGDDE